MCSSVRVTTEGDRDLLVVYALVVVRVTLSDSVGVVLAYVAVNDHVTSEV